MYHISLNPLLTGIWSPKIPKGSDTSQWLEPPIARISLAPTIEQALWSIYFNYLGDFNRAPHLDFYVYSPVITKETKLLNNDILKRYIFDAFVTKEIGIVSNVKMVKVAKVRVYKPDQSTMIKAKPFGNVEGLEFNISPRFNWKKLDNFFRNAIPKEHNWELHPLSKEDLEMNASVNTQLEILGANTPTVKLAIRTAVRNLRGAALDLENILETHQTGRARKVEQFVLGLWRTLEPIRLAYVGEPIRFKLGLFTKVVLTVTQDSNDTITVVISVDNTTIELNVTADNNPLEKISTPLLLRLVILGL